MKLTAFFLALLTPCLSVAQELPCAETEEMFHTLQDKWGEELVFMGTAGENARISIWFSPDTQSFSVVVTTPVNSCLAASGGDGELIAFPPNL